MEGSVQTEQALLAELRTLRARVAELEQSLAHIDHSQPLSPPLQEGEARFRHLLQNDSLGSAIADFQGRLLEVNTAFLDMLGYSQVDFDNGQLRWDTITPTEFQSLDTQAISELKLHGVCAPYEKQLIARNGHRVPVLVCDIMLKGTNNRYIAYILDLTENKKLAHTVQQTVQKAEEQARELEGIFETITDGLAVYNLQGDVIRMNGALRSLLGIDATPLYPVLSIKQRAELIHLQDDQGQTLAPENWPAERVLRGEILTGRSAVDIRLLTFDGQSILLNTSGAPLYDRSGAIVAGVVLFHDVTERRQLEQRLREANQRMDEFLSVASHELRTPLTTINGNIQLAKRRLKTLITSQEVREEQANKLDFVQELLNRAERQVRVQNRLVGDLLDVSRIQANRLELHITQGDLAEIVREAVEDQRSASPSRTINLELPYATAIPIEADRDRIEQALTNYLTNALKYSASERPVTIRLEVETGQVRVLVHDEGPGLPAEELARLWQRFYRVPNITVLSGTGVGLGLGLYICKTIIERHHGQVGVNSTPNMGSTFWFTLPVVDPATFIE